MGCHLWGHTESDTTEATQQQQQQEDFYETNSCWSLKEKKEVWSHEELVENFSGKDSKVIHGYEEMFKTQKTGKDKTNQKK